MIKILDIFLLLFLFYFFLIGWHKGIVRLLLGPLAFGLASAIAGLYFLQTNQFIYSFVILILGFFILSLLLSKGLSLWNKSVCEGRPSWLPSKVLGASVASLWAGLFLTTILVIISILPNSIPLISKPKKAVLNSSTYAFINDHILKHIISQNKLKQVAALLSFSAEDQSPGLLKDQDIEKIQASEEFQALQDNKDIQNILEDEQLIKNIEDKNFTAVLQSPHIRALLQNKAAMKDLQGLYLRFFKDNFSTQMLSD
jgi:hypothetical protein